MSADCKCGDGICMLLYLVLYKLCCVYRNRPADTKYAATKKKKFKKRKEKKSREVEATSCHQRPSSSSATMLEGKLLPDLLLPLTLLLCHEAEGFHHS